MAAVYEKIKELAELIGKSPTIGAGWHFPQFGGVAVVIAGGATQEEARQKIVERANKPF